MKRFGLVVVAVTALAGCASKVPPEIVPVVQDRLAPPCAALFADAKYQDYAQGLHATPVFAVAASEDGKNMVCSYAALDLLNTLSQRNQDEALQRCEAVKPIWTYANDIPLGPCRVFARGNTIVKDQ